MRLFNFLNENISKPTLDDLFEKYKIKSSGLLSLDQDILDKINKECSEIIKIQYNDGLLFRGVKYPSNQKRISQSIYEIIPKKDRRPSDTHPEDQILIDDLFYKKFKWRPRSEGTFVTSEMKTARSYGTVMLFLPINNFEYVWSKQYDDLYSNFFETIDSEIDETIYEQMEKVWYYYGSDERVDNLSDFDGYVETRSFYGNQAVIVILNEDGEKIEVNVYQKEKEFNRDKYDKIYKEIKHDLVNDVIQTYTDKDLKSAIDSKHEIMFKCKYYYGIDLTGRI